MLIKSATFRVLWLISGMVIGLKEWGLKSQGSLKTWIDVPFPTHHPTPLTNKSLPHNRLHHTKDELGAAFAWNKFPEGKYIWKFLPMSLVVSCLQTCFANSDWLKALIYAFQMLQDMWCGIEINNVEISTRKENTSVCEGLGVKDGCHEGEDVNDRSFS